MTRELLIGMRLADKSIYPLYALGERGVKRLVLSAASQNQDKIELRFYYYTRDDATDEIADIVLEKAQMPGESWVDLDLECSLDKSSGLQIQLASSGEVLLSRLAILPQAPEEKIEEKENSESRPVLAFILASLFLFASITGSYYTGKTFSSEAPPDLSITD